MSFLPNIGFHDPEFNQQLELLTPVQRKLYIPAAVFTSGIVGSLCGLPVGIVLLLLGYYRAEPLLFLVFCCCVGFVYSAFFLSQICLFNFERSFADLILQPFLLLFAGGPFEGWIGAALASLALCTLGPTLLIVYCLIGIVLASLPVYGVAWAATPIFSELTQTSLKHPIFEDNVTQSTLRQFMAKVASLEKAVLSKSLIRFVAAQPPVILIVLSVIVLLPLLPLGFSLNLFDKLMTAFVKTQVAIMKALPGERLNLFRDVPTPEGVAIRTKLRTIPDDALIEKSIIVDLLKQHGFHFASEAAACSIYIYDDEQRHFLMAVQENTRTHFGVGYVRALIAHLDELFPDRTLYKVREKYKGLSISDLKDASILGGDYKKLEYTEKTTLNNNIWFAICPELPGCMVEADSQDETLHLLREARNEWIDCVLPHRWHVPLPQSFGQHTNTP